MWQELEAESIAQRRHFGYLPTEETEPEPAVAPSPEPVKPKSKKRKTLRKQKPPETPQSKAWSSLHEMREHLRAERGDDLID